MCGITGIIDPSNRLDRLESTIDGVPASSRYCEAWSLTGEGPLAIDFNIGSRSVVSLALSLKLLKTLRLVTYVFSFSRPPKTQRGEWRTDLSNEIACYFS